MDQKIYLSVGGIRVDEETNSPILLLSNEDDTRVMPIWIGSIEAVSIAYANDNVPTPRPLTHELMINIIESLNGKVHELIIDDIVDETFHAHLVLNTMDGNISIPCRPSDGISIAIRSDAPICVDKELFESTSIELVKEDIIEEFDDFIKDVKPSDFL
tara:strand:- start:5704 stop:6177 length:474 start_codon:yes stop_codon:yes gene_type:complete